MMATPVQRSALTSSCRTIRAAKAVMTNPSDVSGQMRLTSLGRANKAARRRTSSRTARQEDVPVARAAPDDAAYFAGGDFFHLADFMQSLAQKNDAHGLEHEADQKYGDQLGHITNPGNESVRCRVFSPIPSRAD
jgi:hypothetical protein